MRVMLSSFSAEILDMRQTKMGEALANKIIIVIKGKTKP